jgi:tetratricopeptide (TPR) repeat protein
MLFSQKKDEAGARAAFRAAVKAEPGHALAWKWLGAMLERVRDKEEASKAFAEAVKIDPTDEYAIQRVLGTGTGGTSRAPDYAVAILRFREILEALGGPDDAANARIGRQLAWLLGRSGETEEALAVLAKVEKADPEAQNNHVYRADVLLSAGKLDEAIGEYKKAVEMNPAAKYAYDELYRLALRRVGDLKQRIALLEWLFETRKDARVANDLGFTYRDGVRDFQKSLSWYLKAVELAPDDVDILNDTGLIYQYHLNADDKAIPYYEKAIELGRDMRDDPPRGYIDAMENYAKILVKRKQYEKAEPLVKEVLRYQPNRPDSVGLKSVIDSNR